MKKTLFLMAFAVILLSACSSSGPQGISVSDVVFAKDLSENFEPVDPTTTFYPDEIVNVSVRVPGRPKEGVLGARFLYTDQLIAEATVDFADANSGLLFSVGEDTFAGFTLTHNDLLYISPLYSVELLVDGSPVGTYKYSVIPPADAIPTVVRETVFATGVTENIDPIDPKEIFSSGDVIHYIGQGDFGRLSYLQVDWYLNGDQLIQDCTSGVTVDQNLPDDRFYFSCALDSGWSSGSHKVVLTVDDVVTAEEFFTVE